MNQNLPQKSPSLDQLNFLSELPYDTDGDRTPIVLSSGVDVDLPNDEVLSDDVLEGEDDLYEPIGHRLARQAAATANPYIRPH
jgi:hypothetical protein